MRIAFLFPGQGSQSVGMLEGFKGNPNVERSMQQASAAINQDLAALIANGPAEELNLTVNTQPIMLASSLAFFRAYQKAGGPTPSDFAGHSLGEYTALVAAGRFGVAGKDRVAQFEGGQDTKPSAVGLNGSGLVLVFVHAKREFRVRDGRCCSVQSDHIARVHVGKRQMVGLKACSVENERSIERPLKALGINWVSVGAFKVHVRHAGDGLVDGRTDHNATATCSIGVPTLNVRVVTASGCRPVGWGSPTQLDFGATSALRGTTGGVTRTNGTANVQECTCGEVDGGAGVDDQLRTLRHFDIAGQRVGA